LGFFFFRAHRFCLKREAKLLGMRLKTGDNSPNVTAHIGLLTAKSIFLFRMRLYSLFRLEYETRCWKRKRRARKRARPSERPAAAVQIGLGGRARQQPLAVEIKAASLFCFLFVLFPFFLNTKTTDVFRLSRTALIAPICKRWMRNTFCPEAKTGPPTLGANQARSSRFWQGQNNRFILLRTKRWRETELAECDIL